MRPWPWILVALVTVVVLPVMKDPEAAYPEMIKRFVPPGWMGVVIASFLGAFMSTIDTQLNLLSSFAVNDVYFARQSGVAADQVNCFGSPPIWGPPQAPTGLRAIVDLIEELVQRGGGDGLFSGCAAGDTAMAVVLKVS